MAVLIAHINEVGEADAPISKDHSDSNTSPVFGCAGFITRRAGRQEVTELHIRSGIKDTHRITARSRAPHGSRDPVGKLNIRTELRIDMHYRINKPSHFTVARICCAVKHMGIRVPHLNNPLLLILGVHDDDQVFTLALRERAQPVEGLMKAVPFTLKETPLLVLGVFPPPFRSSAQRLLPP